MNLDDLMPEPNFAEFSARRPEWDGYAWGPMSDGKEWAFPLADVALLVRCPEARDALAEMAVAAKRAPVPAPAIPPDLFTAPPNPEFIAANRRWQDGIEEQARRIHAVGRSLLRANYDIDDHRAERLLDCPPGPDEFLNPRPWLDALGLAIEGAGPEAVALVKSRGVPDSMN